MSIDVLHHGHINIIQQAIKYGDVIIGLLTDSAIAEYKRIPYLEYENRKRIVQNIVGVSQVVKQNEWDYAPNLKKYRPDFMIHGDDWLSGPLAPYRTSAINALSEYGGRLIEIPYTNDVSSTAIVDDLLSNGISADFRKASLSRLLRAKSCIRLMEAHSPISALIVENSKLEVAGKVKFFDGFWSSSLTDSIEMGKPDIEALDISIRLSNINNIFEVTTKPLIMDLDTGGKPEHFEINVRTIERLGVSAVIIEDKTGLKKNSLFGNDVTQIQEDVDVFCQKIRIGRASRLSPNFMIIARIESLILEKGMEDAITRSRAYVKAGADGIMIHSRLKQPNEIFEFARLFRLEFPFIPLVSVPTSYNHVTELELAAKGFNVIIYANHLMRASYPAMKQVALEILRHGRSAEIDNSLIGINEALELIRGTK